MRTGERVGAYEIEESAGGGGMGEIYRARDAATGRPVALKILTELDADSDRFFREARILAELRHPAIVRYLGHGRTLGGEPYLAMEWLEGEDLGARLRRAGLAIEESLLLVRRVAEALAEAHGRGVVHRDLKPANVFLPGGRLEEAKLLDFGVARPALTSEARLTRTGVLVGTPSYMAPEQVRGASTVDARADVFALGCLLYQCLAGKPAFMAEHLLGVLARVLFQEPPRLCDARPDVPPALDALVLRMLAKDPLARPADGGEVARELAALGAITGAAPAATSSPVMSTVERLVVSVVLVSVAEGPRDDELRRTVARRHGATLERVTSETLVAALAARGPAVDQAADAARLALALGALLPGAPVALATGRGVVGGSMPVGDAIDRAARLLEQRRPGVWVDEVSSALLSTRFEVEAGRLVRERDETEAARTLLGRTTPCVGRDRELALLDDALADCVSRPAARALLITAPSGLGKSRLAHEWTRRLAARRHPARVLVCRAEPMSAGAPFVLAAQLVRRGAHLVEGAPPEEQLVALADHLSRLVSEEDLPRLLAFLGELARLPVDEDSDDLRAARRSPLLMGDQLRLAWEDWLAAETAARPVVLVVEDLHWGDAASVALIDAALRSLRERPLLVLALGRRETHELFPDLWAERELQEVRLGELSRRASEELARAVLGPAADPVTIAWIGERAGGHALYLEEVIRSVAAGEREAVPPSVVAMVQARLTALVAEARRVLRAACVFGEVFWRGGVAALVGRPEDEVAEILDELVGREAVTRRRTSRFPGQAEFSFRHALFREAADAMLTDEDRVLGHRLAADWLLAAGERQALVLAEHLERGGEHARAAEHYLVAAEEALAGNDFAGALHHAGLGIAVGGEGPLRARLRLVQSEAHAWRAEEADAEWTALDALDHLPEGGAPSYDAMRHALAAHLPAKRPLLDRICALLERPPATAEARRAYVMAAVAACHHLSFHGERPAAWTLLERAEVVAAEVDEADSMHAFVLRSHASALDFQGKHDQALRFYQQAARRFEAVGDLRNACQLGTNIGWLQATELGMHADAERALCRSLEKAARMGLARGVAVAKQNLGVAVMRQGRLDEARALLLETVDEFARHHDERMEGGSRFYLTLLYTSAGELDQAEAQALRARELAREVPTTRACTLAALARALVAAGRPADALARAREADAILAGLGGIEEGESLIRLALAEALWAAGEKDEARLRIAAALARVDERAALMTDAEVRRCFLEEVPENARTRALAAELLPPRAASA